MALLYGHALLTGSRAPHNKARPAAESVLDLALPAEDSLTGAACVGADPGLFFPDAADARSLQLAKAVCAACPVIEQCLSGALRRGERYGVFGGLTVEERDVLTGRRKRKVAVCGTIAGYNRHRRLKQRTCLACRRVATEQARERYNRRQAEKAVAA